MKKSILICIIILSLSFSACYHNTTNQESVYEIKGTDSRILTESERSQAIEEQLIKRLQSTIEMLDNVNEAIVNINNSSDTKKIVEISIATEPNYSLTDEQKTSITNLISACFSEEQTVTVDLQEKQNAD